jgi:hypothetical protein
VLAQAAVPDRRWIMHTSKQLSYKHPCFFLRNLQGIDRRERLRRLAMETIDLAKDPYYMRNHLGQVSWVLCFCRVRVQA